MPAYMVSQYRNSKELDAYRAAASALNAKHGARILTKAGTARCIEGDWQSDSMVIIEFASMDAAKQFFESKEYAEVKALRKNAPPLTIVVMEGAAP
jgi:uncharacterized protein (DUF1330 family)